MTYHRFYHLLASLYIAGFAMKGFKELSWILPACNLLHFSNGHGAAMQVCVPMDYIRTSRALNLWGLGLVAEPKSDLTRWGLHRISELHHPNVPRVVDCLEEMLWLRDCGRKWLWQHRLWCLTKRVVHWSKASVTSWFENQHSFVGMVHLPIKIIISLENLSSNIGMISGISTWLKSSGRIRRSQKIGKKMAHESRFATGFEIWFFYTSHGIFYTTILETPMGFLLHASCVRRISETSLWSQSPSKPWRLVAHFSTVFFWGYPWFFDNTHYWIENWIVGCVPLLITMKDSKWWLEHLLFSETLTPLDHH